MDKTAGMALHRVNQEQYWDKLHKVQENMDAALQAAERKLKAQGYHLEGAFEIVDDKTNWYLKVRRA